MRTFVKSCRDADNLPLTIDGDEEPSCPRCGLGNFPNMPGELCDDCQLIVENLCARVEDILANYEGGGR